MESILREDTFVVIASKPLGNLFLCSPFLLTQLASRFELSVAFFSDHFAETCEAIAFPTATHASYISTSGESQALLRLQNVLGGRRSGGGSGSVVSVLFSSLSSCPPSGGTPAEVRCVFELPLGRWFWINHRTSSAKSLAIANRSDGCRESALKQTRSSSRVIVASSSEPYDPHRLAPA